MFSEIYSRNLYNPGLIPNTPYEGGGVPRGPKRLNDGCDGSVGIQCVRVPSASNIPAQQLPPRQVKQLRGDHAHGLIQDQDHGLVSS